MATEKKRSSKKNQAEGNGPVEKPEAPRSGKLSPEARPNSSETGRAPGKTPRKQKVPGIVPADEGSGEQPGSCAFPCTADGGVPASRTSRSRGDEPIG